MMSSPKLLFIEPKQPASPGPVIDHITRRMCAAFRQARVSDYAYGGFHICNCGAVSSCTDYHLPNGDLTNSLCVHYVAHHRLEVPQEQLARIEAFTLGELEPTDHELRGGRWIQETTPRLEEYPEYPPHIRQVLKKLDAQIEALNQEKEAAVMERDFKTAAGLRDQSEHLRHERNNILCEWRVSSGSTVPGRPGTKSGNHAAPGTSSESRRS